MSKLYNKYKQPTEGETGTTKKMGERRFNREHIKALKLKARHRKAKEIKKGNKMMQDSNSSATRMRST